MKVVRCEILEVDIPFKLTFKHSLKERAESDSIFLRLRSDKGDTGWGESLPRAYVTGETPQEVVRIIRDVLLPVLAEHPIQTWEEALELASGLEKEARKKNPDLPDRIGAARCALELAFLDLAGNHFRRSVSDIFWLTKKGMG